MKLVKWIELQREDGFDIVLWSMQGRAYAENVASRFGIKHLFTAIVSKPGVVIDDEGMDWIQKTRIVKGVR